MPAPFPGLQIIDWDLVTHTNAKVLLSTRNQTILHRVTQMFLRSTSLFSDPSYSAPDLVLKLFLLMKVVLIDLLSQRDELREIADHHLTELKTLKSYRARLPPKLVFQCPYCPKVFETQHFVQDHLRRRHTIARKTQTEQPVVKPEPVEEKPHISVVEQPISEGAHEAEIAAILDHCQTLMHNQEIQLRAELNDRIRMIEEDREVHRMLGEVRRRQRSQEEESDIDDTIELSEEEEEDLSEPEHHEIEEEEEGDEEESMKGGTNYESDFTTE
jgi:hypothetical protein